MIISLSTKLIIFRVWANQHTFWSSCPPSKTGLASSFSLGGLDDSPLETPFTHLTLLVGTALVVGGSRRSEWGDRTLKTSLGSGTGWQSEGVHGYSLSITVCASSSFPFSFTASKTSRVGAVELSRVLFDIWRAAGILRSGDPASESTAGMLGLLWLRLFSIKCCRSGAEEAEYFFREFCLDRFLDFALAEHATPIFRYPSEHKKSY